MFDTLPADPADVADDVLVASIGHWAAAEAAAATPRWRHRARTLSRRPPPGL